MSQLGFYQPITMTNWQAGFGFHWHTDANGYLRTYGDVDARHFGRVMRMTKPVKSDSENIRKDGFIVFKGDVYAWTRDGVRKWSAARTNDSWNAVSDTGAVNAMWHNGRYIFSVVDGDRIEYGDSGVSDSGDWTLTGVNDSAVNFKYLYHHDGFAYAVKDANDSGEKGNQVYYDDDIALTGLHGNPTDDPNVVYVGLDGMQVGRPQSYQGDLYFPRADGLYQMDKGRASARRWLDYFDQADTDNFQSMAVWNGFLVYPIKDKLFRWNGVAETNITPPIIEDTSSAILITYGSFKHLTTIGQRLWCVGRTNEPTGYTRREHILCYDGAGWQNMSEPVVGGGEITAMKYDPANNRLWYYLDAGDSSATYYIPFQNQSDLPFANFDTGGTHAVISSRIDAGFRMIIKSTPSIWVGAKNCDDSTFISIWYKLDDATVWSPWGGIDGTTNTVKQDGIIELTNPDTDGSANSTIEYNHITVLAKLETSDSTKTPILEDLVLRVMMRPQTLYGFTLPIVLSDKVKYGLMEGSERPRTILQRLKDIRNSKAPVNFVDPYGDSYRGYLSSLTFQLTEQHADEMGPQDNIEGRCWATFVQVG